MSITIKQIRVFNAIATHGNLGIAAESLFLTKAALSMALQELEKQLGHPLFDRINNRLHLNEQGQRLLPLADELLQRAQQIEHHYLDDNMPSGRLILGASNTIGNYILPKMLSVFMARYPACQPKVVIENTHFLIEQLEEFQLDICLVEGGALINRAMRVVNWLQDEMSLVCSPAYPLARLHQQGQLLTLSDFENQHWIVREQGSGVRDHFNHTVLSKLEHCFVRLELNQSEAILSACRYGLGIAYMSNEALQTDLHLGSLYRLPFPYSTSRQLHIVTHPQKYISPLLNEFLLFCQTWSLS